jgi:hypothetical protein
MLGLNETAENRHFLAVFNESLLQMTPHFLKFRSVCSLFAQYLKDFMKKFTVICSFFAAAHVAL